MSLQQLSFGNNHSAYPGFYNTNYLQTDNQNKAYSNKDIFYKPIKENKAVKYAHWTVEGIGVLALLVYLADCIGLKGRSAGFLSKSLKTLAKSRVDNNVVKRQKLTFGSVTADINNFVKNNTVKKGEAVNVFKAKDVPDAAGLKNLKLKDNAVVLAKDDGSILKIYDTAKLDNDVAAAVQKTLKVTI